MYIVEVVPISKGLKSPTLTYFTAKEFSVGSLVGVPLRSKEILALAIRKEKVLDMRALVRSADFKLKNVHTIYDYQIFNAPFLEMAEQLARYYTIGIGNILSLVLPKAIVDKPEKAREQKTGETRSETKNLGFILQQKSTDRIQYYKTRSRELLANKQSLVIICPTQDRAQDIFKKISEGIPDRCFLFHGKSTQKTLQSILTHKQNTNRPEMVFIGTASILSLIPNTGTFEYIIDESSSMSYQSIAEPCIDLRLAVELHARASGQRYVYADSLIDVGTWHRYKNSELDGIEPVTRSVLDVSHMSILPFTSRTEIQSESERITELQHTQSKFHPLHYKMLSIIQDEIANNKKVFCFVPRKGVSPQIVCNDCGQIARSEQSGLPFSLYVRKEKDGRSRAIYLCPATGEQVDAFSLCQFCRGSNLQRLGISTESFSAELSSRFPNVRIEIIDREKVTTKKQQQYIQELHSSDQAVLWVGTQLGLEILPYWDTSLVVSLHSLFSQASYQNEERVLHTLIRLQEKTKGSMYLQDRQNILDLLPILQDGLHHSFINQELAIRKDLQFPPFRILISIEVDVKKEHMKKTQREYQQLLQEYYPSSTVYPSSQKNYVRLVVRISVEPQTWSLNNQDPKLYEILITLRKQARIYINPKSFLNNSLQ